jgi:hypothetical protein
MSTSTDALFFYGICWNEEDHVWPWEGEEDGDENVDPDEILADLDLEDRLTIGTHCMATCPMGYVAIADTMSIANRGYPRRVDEALRNLDPEVWAEETAVHLRKFCDAVGYDFDALVKDGRVGWWVCSDTDWSGR